MLIGIIVILALSFLILGHEAGHFFIAKLFGMKVDEFGFGFPPRIFAKKVGETEYSLNWLPFGGFVRIAGELEMGQNENPEDVPQEKQSGMFYTRPAWQRMLVIVAGVTINFLLGWFLISGALMVGLPEALVISGIEANSPAASAGLKEGDVLRDYTNSSSFINFINAHKGEDIAISVERNGDAITLHATPRAVVVQGQGALGAYLEEGGAPAEGFFAALYDGFVRSIEIAWLTLIAFYQLVQSLVVHATLLEGVVGPVGIVRVAQGAGFFGLIYLVNLVGLISLNLAVINLLPFPALDGGRLFMILIEKVKGSPVSRRIESVVNTIGLAVLILLMVLVTFRDVHALFI